MENINDPLGKIREKYKNHSTILANLQQLFGNKFSFRIVPKEDIEKEILKLNDTKTSQQSDIPTKIMKMNVDVFCEMIHLEIN